jgi:hypothetical protein
MLPPGERIADKSTVGERADYFNALALLPGGCPNSNVCVSIDA